MKVRSALAWVVAAAALAALGAHAPAQSSGSAEAEITLVVPAGAEVFFNGKATTQTGTERSYATPTLTAGKVFYYEVLVRWQEDGKAVERTMRVEVRANDRVRHDFTTSAPQDRDDPLKLGAPHTDPLPSWNDGAAKKAILEFVRVTTDKGGAKYVPPEQRIAVFDQDGTLWVEHPMYTQMIYCLDRVPAVVKEKPELKDREPFKTVLSGDREAIAKLPLKDLEEILSATLTGMPEDDFQAEVKKWLKTAKHPRWDRPYTELTYQLMLEVLKYFRANGYKTYIVTGGGQDFVRVYAEQVYGIPPEQVVGSMGGTKYGYDRDGKPFLTKEPRLLLNDNNAGKPEGIHLMIGRRPCAAFGNSTGDREMLEYTTAGDGARLGMLLLHDDAKREYAYGPAEGLPDTKVGTFTQALYDEAKKRGWVVISMKEDWRRLFPFDK